jgi:HK97 family phage portal protein
MILDKIFAADPISDLRNPAHWLVTSLGGGKSSSGVTVNSTNALTVATYYACLRNLSEDLGTVPLFLYETLEPRGREKKKDHPLWQILTLTPNDSMVSTVFRQAMDFAVLSWGNAYAEIVKNRRGNIVALNFIHPSRVKPRMENGVLFYEVHGDVNGRTVNVRLEREEMLHYMGPSEDGIEGLSMIQMAKNTLGVAISEQDFNGEIFANGAVVSGVLSHPKTLDAETHSRLRESWKNFTGTGNRNKPLILEEEMKWTQMGIPPRDAQFIESRNFTVSELARWFRMPPHKLMHLEDATYSNIESQDLQYVNDTLMPWFIRFEQEMTLKLLTEGERARGLFICHKVEGRLRGDAISRATFYRSLFNMGALSPNDIREMENQNPIGPEGDRYYLQINIAPIEDLPALAADRGNQAPTDTEESEVAEEAQSAAQGILVRDAVERVCRRSVKAGKQTDSFLLSQQEYMRSTLQPIAVAFDKQLDPSFFSTLTHDDFRDAGSLYTSTMEMINGYPA